MIRIRQIEIDVNQDSQENLLKKICFKLNLKNDNIHFFKIHKKSLDARRKPALKFIYEVDVSCDFEDKILKKKDINILKTPDENYILPTKGNSLLKNSPIVVGAGPAGLFAAYLLAQEGYKPLIIERGEKVEDRVQSVEEFWKTGNLKINSNVQFGEGGAGTFSDGKLNTLTKDPNHRMRKVFEIFVECGANEDILYDYKPHIGTDILRKVVQTMRNKIIDMGGVFRYQTCLTNIIKQDNKIMAIEINHQEQIPCEVLILAIGHSARDTFQMLDMQKVKMTPKPFAVGVRIQHPQMMINESQYGINDPQKLPPASYKLTYTTKSGRGVYSFCMCPGGYVVNASSEEGMLAINGMSNHSRESENANSAIVVSVTPDDFGNKTLDGLEFQRRLEHFAFQIGHGNIPIQLYGDFKEKRLSKEFGSIKPIYKGNYQFADLNEIFPDYITESLKEGIDYFGRKIKGFDRIDAILAGIESRTSSPVRIERDENLESSVQGLYPCGEGSGYAGGITTAAMDGMKVAEQIISTYQSIQ